jgi:hypothetical protein
VNWKQSAKPGKQYILVKEERNMEFILKKTDKAAKKNAMKKIRKRSDAIAQKIGRLLFGNIPKNISRSA